MAAAITAYIGIGSNLDDPMQQVSSAVAALQVLPDTLLLALSPWYRSTPVGGPAGQPDYINGVAAVETSLAPQTLLEAMQAIEQTQGRVRRERWGARTLDLDLLLYGDTVLDDPILQLPHPRLCERAFVLVPLHNIAPGLALPNGCRIASLLPRVSTAGLWPVASDPASQISPGQ